MSDNPIMAGSPGEPVAVTRGGFVIVHRADGTRGGRVTVRSVDVETLLRLEREERHLAERMQRDAIRRAALRPLILAARCSLTAVGAREYQAWSHVRAEDRRTLVASRRAKETTV